MVTCFHYKKQPRPDYIFNLVNAGAYLFSKEAFGWFTDPHAAALEKDLILHFFAEQTVYAYNTTEYLKDMGTVDRLDETQQNMRSGLLKQKCLRSRQKCVFIDRDGTINKLNGLVDSPDKFVLEDSAAEGLKKLIKAGFLCIVITNQPVIARNLCDFDTLNTIHKKMDTLLGEQHAFVTDVFFCPHHPHSGYEGERKEYKIKWECRKPGTKLIDDAVEKYNIDLSQSYFVGDTTMDIQTGINCGVKTILVKTGEAGQDKKYDVVPDAVCEDLSDAADYILQQ